MNKTENSYECIVVGGGPGGLLAALYLLRFKRKVLVIRHGTPRAKWIPRIQNLIGQVEAPTGRELLQKIHQQVAELGAEIIEGEAKVNRLARGFEVETGGRRYRARKVILATGIEDIQPCVDNCYELCGEGVLGYCAICDGYDHSDQPIGLLVQDASGLKKLKFIAKFSPDLKLIVLGDLEISGARRKEIERLKVPVFQGELLKLEAQKKPRGLWIHLRRRKPIFVRLAYVALGSRVRDSAFRHLKSLKRTREGYFQVSSHQMTSIRGFMP